MENIISTVDTRPIEEFCNDFDFFCNYLMENKVKLSKNTFMIGKKACYEMNQKLKRSEKYETAGRFQDRYPVIHFMYYIAFSYQILEMEPGKGYVVPGCKYEAYAKASLSERYLLFFTNYIYDGTCWEYCEYDYIYCMREFLEWINERDDREEVCLVSARLFRLYDDPVKSTIPVLEELGLIRLEECIGNKRCIEKCKIKIFPIMYLMAERYGEVEGNCKRIYVEDEKIQRRMTEYLHYFAPDSDTGFYDKLYQEVFTDIKKPRQSVRIEAALRYYDCSREILLSSEDTLEDLHYWIQEAFKFDNDHLYLFHVGKGMFKTTYCASEEFAQANEMSAQDTRLSELPLRKGFCFEYLFDFGDNWWFDLKVKECVDGEPSKKGIVKRSGKAPEQYCSEW